MTKQPSRWLAFAIVLASSAMPGTAAPGDETLPAPRRVEPGRVQSAAPVAVVALTLDDCLRLAMQRQPALAAHRASLDAAEDGRRAIESLHIPAILARELTPRRKQATLGVYAASAGLSQAERDTNYAVIRSYFTVVYAQQQERVARDVVERLGALSETINDQLEGNAKDVTIADQQRAALYVDLADVKRIQAAKGIDRGRAALREAIGLGPDCSLEVALTELQEPTARPCRDAILAAALAQRGEFIQSVLLGQVTELEIVAQRSSLGFRMETFAHGADIHSRAVPATAHNGEYRPGAVPPEMPGMLVGCMPQRVAHARSLAARAAAVSDKTRNLIALEAEDAFLRWEEASQKAARARRAAANGEKLAEGLRQDFTNGQKVRVDDVLTAQVLAAQARSQFYEYVYHQILALADLERITGGAFCAGLTAPPQPVERGVSAEPKAVSKSR